MNNEEIWKPIVGYEGRFEVSNMGNVRSLEHDIIDKKGRKYHKRSKVITKQIGPSGYLQVGLFLNGRCKTCKVHRLVAEAFIDNPENKQYIDHVNTNRQDNRVENLRWCTLKENSNNPITLFRHQKTYHKQRRIIFDTDKKFSKISKSISIYDKNGVHVKTFPSMMVAEQVTGVEMSSIRKALDKPYRTAGGYLWRSDNIPYSKPYKRRRHTKCRHTIMVDTKGNVIKEWDAVRDAAKELNTTHTRILRYMQENRQMDGYLFKYK